MNDNKERKLRNDVDFDSREGGGYEFIRRYVNK
jgi:hypothetical protein